MVPAAGTTTGKGTARRITRNRERRKITPLWDIKEDPGKKKGDGHNSASYNIKRQKKRGRRKRETIFIESKCSDNVSDVRGRGEGGEKRGDRSTKSSGRIGGRFLSSVSNRRRERKRALTLLYVEKTKTQNHVCEWKRLSTSKKYA